MSILSAIPAELITGAVSGLISFGASIFAMKQKQRAEEQRMLLERHAADEQSRVRAESGSAKDRESKRWVRRTIAITATASILVFPMLAPILGLNVFFGYTEMTGGFWPFVDSNIHTVWHEFYNGIAVTPFHTHVYMTILGFYFGASAAESARSR